ncbi:MAG: inositol monophosphatase [Acidobacteriota bacterium]
MKLDLEDVLRTIRPLVEEQGKLAVRRGSSAVPRVHKDRRDFATAVDLEIERNLKAELHTRYPDHGLSGEETGDEHRDADYQWLIDPIDGTKYYAGHSSLYTVSVGLLYRGDPVLGIVYAAASGQCFYAWQGGGAFVNGQALQVNPVSDLSQVVLNVDTPKTHLLLADERAWFEAKLVELSREVYRVRALGIGSLAACWLASGALDAYVDLTGYVKPQDVAAGRVILSEAGARVDYVDPGVGPRRLLASSPRLWEELRERLTAKASPC